MTMPDQSLIRHSDSNGIDTVRNVASSDRPGEEAHMGPTAPSLIMPRTSPHQGVVSRVPSLYVAPMTSVNSVITAIEINRPGLSETKRNLLLFFCQGHHLALGGEALFPEALYATDRGVGIDDPSEPAVVQPPSNGALNIINGALLRYGDLSPADLRTLVQASTPWQLAMKSTAGQRIEWAWLRDWFTRPDENNDPDDDRPTKAQLTAWAARRHT